MPLLFVYGSLKEGFPNAHVNTGRRLDGRYRTRDRYSMYLLGSGEVPCIVAPAGSGHQIMGELYEATCGDLERMDRLERVGEPAGYERAEVTVERFDTRLPEQIVAFVYLKRADRIPPSTPRVGPLPEYRLEDAARFHWTGAA